MITYEAVKQNKVSKDGKPQVKWTASSRSDIALFNECPKQVKWIDGNGRECVAKLDKDKENYTITVEGIQRSVNRSQFVKAIPQMPSDTVIESFEVSDIVWW